MPGRSATSRVAGDGLRALDAPGEVGEAAGVASKHDVGVEQGDERIEITVATSLER